MEKRASIAVGLPQVDPNASYWQLPPDAISELRVPDSLPTMASTVIIGSGLSGACIAYNLLKEHRATDVVMLEARQAASGASGRNGGHTKHASYRAFLDNIEAVGELEAVKMAHFEYNCMNAVHDLISDLHIPCDSKRCDTLDIFYDQDELQYARESVARMQDLMGKCSASEYTFYSPQETSDRFLTPRSLGALRYEAGSLSAYKLTIGILKLALNQKLMLQTNTPATSIHKHVDPSGNSIWTVHTPRGTISTSRLILATNGYTPYLLPKLQGTIVPFRGVVTAQRPGSSMPQTGLETTYSFIYKEGYEYMISRPAGTDNEGDIVIGGGLTKGQGEDGIYEYGTTDDTSMDPAISQYLTECTADFFGHNWGDDHPDGRVRQTWSGIMGYSADGYPLVGPVPGEDGLWIDASFQGHGMVLCFLCARAVTQMMAGRDGAELDAWFPRAFKITEKRMQLKFGGRHGQDPGHPNTLQDGLKGTGEGKEEEKVVK